MIYLLIRNDDVSALSQYGREHEILKLFERYRVPQVTAVVPSIVGDPHNNFSTQYYPLKNNLKIVNLLKAYHSKGLLEIAQHGLHHQTNDYRPSLVYDISELEYFQGVDRKWIPYHPTCENEYSEFNGLPLYQQKEKIVRGKKYLEEIFGMDIKTFVFPWNTMSLECLEYLRDLGFECVPGEKDQYHIDGIQTIGCCYWDVVYYPDILNKALKQGKTTFLHFSYHSWMLNDKQFRALDKTLQLISGNANISCVLSHQISSIPKVKEVFRLSLSCEKTIEKTNRFVQRKFYNKEYYVFDRWYYLRRGTVFKIIHIIAKYFGIRSFFFGAACVEGMFVLLMVFDYVSTGKMSMFYVLGVLFFGFVFIGALFLWLRESRVD